MYVQYSRVLCRQCILMLLPARHICVSDYLTLMLASLVTA